MLKSRNTKSGADSIAVFVDKLSRMCHIVPFTKLGFTSAKFLEMLEHEVIRLHVVPEKIISDRDTLFSKNWWPQVTRDLGIKHHLSTAYHPQTDGVTEKMNDVIESALRHYVNEQGDNWDQFL